nr:reverse transcriptase domain-containing protein [Tanacetum cinerariifolium]
IKRWCYNLILAELKFKTSCSIIKDKFMMKAQVHVSKYSAISGASSSSKETSLLNLSSVEPELRTIVEVAQMADNHTMEELLQAPTKGYGEAIVIPEINAGHFEIKTNLLQLVQANPNQGFERENPHTHINNFKRITSTLKFKDVPNDVIKLMIFEETFGEAWERFKEMLRACPHHRFSELAQIDTFYNGLNDNDQDSLNATAGGNLLSKTTREALQIIKNKSKVCYSRNKLNVSRMNTTSRKNANRSYDRNDKLADQISTLVDIFAKKVVAPALVKAVEESCIICGGNHAYYNCPNTDRNQLSVCVAADTYNQVAPQNRASNYMAPPGFAPVQNEPDVLKTLPKPNIPYPSRLNDQKLYEKDTNQMEKFFQFFQDFCFDISFAYALLLMPKFASTIRSLLTNKDKFFELAKIPLNENFSAMLLKNLPEKLGDPGKFLIPCDFSGMDVCHALADLGVAEDVFVKVGKFHFLTDFVVVDFEADPRVPLILGRSFLRTGHALIDVYGEEITLWVNDEAIAFNLNQTTRYSSTYDDLSVNRIDIIDVAREEYAQEILGFSNNSLGGNPTSTSEPILSNSSHSLTPFEGSDFILEEIEAYLKDESISSEIDHAYYDPEGDIYTNLVLNWEKCHFMVKEGIVLGHKISKNGLEVDRAKVDVIAKLPYPTTVKGVRSFLGHAGFYRRFIQDFSKIARHMTHLLEKETPFVFFKDCIDAFETLKKKLTEAPILVVPGWNLPFELIKTMIEAKVHYTMTEKEMPAVVYAFEKFRPYLVLSKSIVYTDHSALKYLLSKQDAKPMLIWWVLLLQEFDIIIRDKKGTENLAADHLSRLENPHKDVFENKDINENFPLEILGKISGGNTSWFVDFANFHAGNFIVKGMLSQQKKKFFKDVKHYF